MKTFMKTTVLLITFIVFQNNLISQPGCEILNNNTMPPSPYQESYLSFDGKGDFLRTQDVEALEFNNVITETFTIEARIKITKILQPQYILGKRYISGWILGYHTIQGGYVSIYFNGSGWKNIHYLGNDTNWHTYSVSYNKQAQTLNTYVDGTLSNTYTEFTYSSLQDNSAFSVGNVGFFPQYGIESVNLSSLWFGGGVDFVKIDVNQASVVNYSFNEGAGQVARDSASYSIVDRTYPGETAYCDSRHFMLGFMPAKDTCDPEWIKQSNSYISKFSPLGSGMQFRQTGGNSEIFSEHFSLGLTVWDGYLINCGKFNTAGGVSANHIAKWDGTNWSALGGGLNHEAVSVISYKGELYATGYFDTAYGEGYVRYIARWDGKSWKNAGNGLNNLGTVMTVFNDELVVGGFFNSAGEVYAPGVARWDGAEWRNMGGGINGVVWALCEFGGELYAGGSFEYANGELCNGIAKLKGDEWKPVGTGIQGGDNLVFVLKVFNGKLYAGGSFTTMNGMECNNIAKFDGTKWATVGTGAKGVSCITSGAHVIDMEVYNGELYVVGQFTEIDGISANKFAKWNDINWCGIEYGMDLRPEDLEIYNGELIINGDFYSISGTEYSNIAKYSSKMNLTAKNNIAPVKYSLQQNYPNPFNPATQIKYSIAGNAQNVRIIVYDIQGRETALLVNQQHDAGNYEINFNGEGLSSGIYFYSMFIENQIVSTKKMLMIK